MVLRNSGHVLSVTMCCLYLFRLVRTRADWAVSVGNLAQSVWLIACRCATAAIWASDAGKGFG